MAHRIGKYTIKTDNRPSIVGFGSIVGIREGKGPLKNYFDTIFTDDLWGEKTFEKAEAKIQTQSLVMALERAKLVPDDIDVIFAGDLLNQCISSSFGLKGFNIPFLGQYGACSTMAQSMLLATLFTDSGLAKYSAGVTSSHFCCAERQFRFPLEYGGQRTPTAQHTVTGGGCVILSHKSVKDKPKIEYVTIGQITDLGIKDANNMGAAMAPSAALTIRHFLEDTKKKPQDFDAIITGDLGKVGSYLLIELLKRSGIDISKNHNDCGLLMFDTSKQDVHAGGSGCGCSGSVLCSLILKKMLNKEIKNILFIATGALMSPTSTQQGGSIPGISHLVNIVIE